MADEFVKGPDGVWRRAPAPTADTPITEEQMREAAQAAEIAAAEGLRQADETGAPVPRYADEVTSEETAKRKLGEAITGAVTGQAGEGVFENPEAVAGALQGEDYVGEMVEALRGEPGSMERVDDNGTRWLLVNDVAFGRSGWVTEDEYRSMPGTYQRVGESDETRAQYLENRVSTLSDRGREALAASLSAGEVGLYTAGNVATAGLLMDAADNTAARAKLRVAAEARPGVAAIGGLAGEITSMATLSGGARSAAWMLGAGEAASPIAKLTNYLATRSTAAASSSATRGAALWATNKGLSAAPLAADAAFGEMQAARAQAALENTELTAAQLLGAAGNGVAWGLGLGVGGAMMRGGYRIGRDKLARMKDNAAKELLTNAQTASAPSPISFKDITEWRRKLRDGGEGAQQKISEWIDTNRRHLDPQVVSAWEQSPANFASTLRKATTGSGMRKTEEAFAALDKMEQRLRDIEINPPAIRSPQKAAQDIAMEAEKRKRKGVTRPATIYGDEIARRDPALLQRSKAVLADARSAVTDVMTALDQAAKQGQQIAAGWFSTDAGRSVLGDLQRVKDKSMREQAKGNRNLGNGYLGMNEAGDVLQKAMKGAPEDARAVLQAQVDELRGRQLGTPSTRGIFGDYGLIVEGNQAALQSLQGARARLFGVKGAEESGGLLGRDGKPVNSMIQRVRNDAGANLAEVSGALEDYQKQLSTYVDSAPASIKADLAKEAAALNQMLDEIRPGLNARGTARALYEEGKRLADAEDGVFIQAETVMKPPLPPEAAEAMDEPSLLERAREYAGTSAADFAISMLPNWIKEPINLSRRLVTKAGVSGKVLEAADQWAARLDQAVERMRPAFESARREGAGVALSPARIGAAVTRGVGMPTTTELDEMRAEDQRQTFDALRSDIEGLLQNPSFAAGMAGMATEGIMEASPALAAEVQMQMTRGLFYLAEEMPQGARDPLNPGEPGAVSMGEMQSWLTRYRAVNDPLVMLKDLGEGRLRSETAETIQAVYPDLFAQMALRVAEQMQGKNPPFATRVQVGLMMGIPGTNLMTGQALLAFQQSYAGAQTPEQAQAVGLNERRAAQAAARMPAASRSSSGRYQTISDRLEADA